MTSNVICLHRSSAAIVKGLPDIADGLAAKLVTLAHDPSEWACEQMGIALEGVRLEVVRLAEALRRESPPSAA